ncbi:MAG: glycosyltransferase family 2 protein [Sphingobacteriales bacterium]|nr:glycosyltransferase family 2 protein [Sphingobacteriales bacterium]
MLNPIDPKDVYVVVPAFNEQAMIRQVVNELLSFSYHIVLVDDGSEKNLYSEISGLSVNFLRHEVNLGQGAALQTGIDYALSRGAKYIVTFDADGQHTAADIEKLLQPLADNEADITLGSRFLPGANHNMPAGRRMILHIGRGLNYLLTGLMLSDAHNGLRAMNRKAAGFLCITENGMAHATELLTQIKKNQLRFKEVPVNIRYTEYSKKKGQSVWGSFRIFFDLLLNKIFK